MRGRWATGRTSAASPAAPSSPGCSPNTRACRPTDPCSGELVSTPLRCPHCGAEIDFAAWRETASCASCGERVRFEAAAAAGVAAAAGDAHVPPQPAPAPARTLFGKPLRFTAAWAAVFLISVSYTHL